ncbi:AAA family ATPase [Leifsonia sp. NPDC058248]|uniref:helix-turn-helix transcriptional regulator n=1 Tax=Leifsonia sp. NPDC058248 TaxID=3346402 RepID=UPI0036D8D7E1
MSLNLATTPLAGAAVGPAHMQNRRNSTTNYSASAPSGRPWSARDSNELTQTLIGRDGELVLLGEFVDSLSHSGSGLLLLGELGVGKTSLLRTAGEMGRGAGYLVLATDGFGRESVLDFSALHKLLFPVLEHLSSLSVSHRTALSTALGVEVGPRSDALVLFNAVHSLLTRAAADRPVLLLVDDLSLVDSSTDFMLSLLARRLSGTRIGLIGTVETLGQRVPFPLERQIVLSRLARGDAEELLDSVEPRLPLHARAVLLEQADGNPLALLELLPEVGRALTLGSGGYPIVALDPDPGVSPFSTQIDDLPERTRRLLLLLALDSGGDLRALPETQLTFDDLAPAERAGLIKVDLATFTARFEHPLIRSTLVARASSGERRVAHLTLAKRQGTRLEARAFHLAEAATDADETVAMLLERAAGVALARGRSRVATQALAQAARMSPQPIERRRRFARAAFVAAETLGEAVLDSGLQEEVGPSDGTSGSMYAALAKAFAVLENGSGSRTACQLAQDAVEKGLHGWDATNRELVDAMHFWLALCLTTSREVQWRAFFEALARMKPEAPEKLRTLSIVLADTAHAQPAQRARIGDMLSALDDRDESVYVHQLLTAATFLDLQVNGRPVGWRLIESGRGRETTLTYIRSLASVTLNDFSTGRWREAQELVSEGRAAVASIHLLAHPVLGMFEYVAALLAGARGESGEAAESAARLDEIAVRLDSVALQRFSHHARTVAACGRADWEDVYGHASAVGRSGGFAPYVPEALLVAYDLVEAGVRTGRIEEARAHYSAMIEAGLPALSPRLAMLTHGAAGLVLDGAGSCQEFESAIAVPHADDWPLDYARVQLEFGSRLRRERCLGDARDQLHSALETFERLGAQPWILRTSSELRVAREHLSNPDVRAPLTAQELVVAELAAEGFSNKEIGERMLLSARTVSGHLYRVFPKLGIVSRSALRDALRGQEHHPT